MFMPGQYHGCLTLTLTHGCWWSDMQGAKSSAAMVEVMTVLDIKNNAWVTVNNGFWVMSEAICQWFSWVTKSRVKIIGKSHHEVTQKMLFTATNVLFYFLHAILCPWNTQFCWKPSSIAHFATVAKDGLFWLRDAPRVDLWRHANARY